MRQRDGERSGLRCAAHQLGLLLREILAGLLWLGFLRIAPGPFTDALILTAADHHKALRRDQTRV